MINLYKWKRYYIFKSKKWIWCNNNQTSKRRRIYSFFKIRWKLFNKNSEKGYESIYILHYPNGSNASVSYGKGIKFVSKDNNYEHKCNTLFGSSGGPILNLSSLKVIGLHRGAIKSKDEIRVNIGTLLKFPLNELKNNKIKEIKMKLNINNKICKIKIGKKQSIGFFCKIPLLDINNMLPVFITNNHIINKDLLYKDNTYLEIIVEDEYNVRNFNLNNRMKYTN